MTAATTIRVDPEVRDRLKAYAESQHLTIGRALDHLLAKEAEEKFWADMEQTSAEEYKLIAVEDGTWPGDDDYSFEEQVIRAEEPRA
jgi:predicted DNA-binding protein